MSGSDGDGGVRNAGAGKGGKRAQPIIGLVRIVVINRGKSVVEFESSGHCLYNYLRNTQLLF